MYIYYIYIYNVQYLNSNICVRYVCCYAEFGLLWVCCVYLFKCDFLCSRFVGLLGQIRVLSMQNKELFTILEQ